MAIIRVALDVPVDCLFDYLAPDANLTDIGLRVRVPFGSRQMLGIIMSVCEATQVTHEKLKYAGQIYRDTPPLPPALLELFRFCNHYYHHPIGQVVMNSLPALLRQSRQATGQAIKQPVQSLEWVLTDAGKAITVSDIPAKSVAKRRLLTFLQENEKVTAEDLKQMTAHTRKLLQTFEILGWVKKQVAIISEAHPTKVSAPTPTPEQAHAISAILAETSMFVPWLLQGITGSGKTEVYLQIAASLLAQQKQILILVPEINLTPQLETVFKKRFPATPLISLHSGLTDRERLQGWLQAQRGKTGIILGTRLAIFTPLLNLGLIIVDEEQDHSFKQQDGLRYSARDLAIYRAKQADIPIILGSATPSLESYHHALTGRYRPLRLHSRAVSGASLPEIHCIDLRLTKITQEGLSEPLLTALQHTLSHKQQSLVFINRRGYAPVLLCKSCSWTATCTRCSSRLVIHLQDRQLRCHYCGHQQPISPACPQCGDQDILPFGQGTQRVESALYHHFPEARILRVDRDSIRRRHTWRSVLEAVHNREVDILVGTQLLAKGHDFPNLALVCVLNADASLYSTDFRAEEQLFAQLIQVAGRAGRADTPGTVLIQTEFPQHPLYRALLKQDYDAHARLLLQERKSAGFPPFICQAVLRAEAATIADALEFLNQATEAAATSEQIAHIQLFDPVPAHMVRLKGRERAQLLVQSHSRKYLQTFLSNWYKYLTSLPARGKVRWHLDVDPLTL